MNPTSMKSTEHLYSLDILRGVAALAVVLWHWNFFFSLGTENIQRQDMPLYDSLSILYTSGHFSVDLFFCLSGFVFCWLYADRISEKRISAYDFFVFRFSRLYPIYIVSIFFIIINQIIIKENMGGVFNNAT